MSTRIYPKPQEGSGAARLERESKGLDGRLERDRVTRTWLE